jgi:hypothetical protein
MHSAEFLLANSADSAQESVSDNLLNQMASRRAIRLELHEHRLPCPYYDTPIEFFSPMTVLSLDNRMCANCGKAFLIENGFAKRLVKKLA